MTTLSENDFISAINDSLLIATYGISSGYRKAKNLSPGDIYSFKTNRGKTGLFRVLNVNGNENGDIEIAVKIQK